MQLQRLWRRVLIGGCAAVVVMMPLSACGQVLPYNPYATVQEQPAPVAPDGTIQWGTFFKSAKVQKDYERLWKMGACRGSNKEITSRVAENRLVVDLLPEGEYSGVVRDVAGTLAGGMIAFVEGGDGRSLAPSLVAQCHPAGVTRFVVTGQAPVADVLRPGMTVRVRTQVDGHGRATEAVRALEIIAPPTSSRPSMVTAGQESLAVGTVIQVHKDLLTVRIEAGAIHRLTLPLARDAVATIEAADFALVAAGDTVEIKGRLWAGEGAMGGGTVFASDVTVRKPERRDSPRPAVPAVTLRVK